MDVTFIFTAIDQSFDCKVDCEEEIIKTIEKLKEEQENLKNIKILGCTVRGKKVKLDSNYVTEEIKEGDSIIIHSEINEKFNTEENKIVDLKENLSNIQINKNVSETKNEENEENNIAILVFETQYDEQEVQILGYKANFYEHLDSNLDSDKFWTLNIIFNNKDPIPFYKRERKKIEMVDLEERKVIDICYYKFKRKGKHKIMMKAKEKINDLSFMFEGCSNLIAIEKFFNVDNVKNFIQMFYGCKSLFDIRPLEKWNVSNANYFTQMFDGCESLSDIKPLEKWNVSNATNFSFMFRLCYSLSDISPLEKWNVRNATDFGYTFSDCKFLSDIRPLENWDVSKVHSFVGIFKRCYSLSDIRPLEKWNVTNAIDFRDMFYFCKSLSDIRPLENWDVSKVINFENMFCGCFSLKYCSNIKKWNIKELANIKSMFEGCKNMEDKDLIKIFEQKRQIKTDDSFCNII